MTTVLLVLPMLAAFFAGAAVGVWWMSGGSPVMPHKDIDELARRDRRRWSENADERWYEQHDGWVQ